MAAAHSDCCFLAPCTHILTYLLSSPSFSSKVACVFRCRVRWSEASNTASAADDWFCVGDDAEDSTRIERDGFARASSLDQSVASDRRAAIVTAWKRDASESVSVGFVDVDARLHTRPHSDTSVDVPWSMDWMRSH